MESRPWRWFEVKVHGLLDKPPLIEPWTGRLLYQTRLQNAIMPQPSAARTAEN